MPLRPREVTPAGPGHSGRPAADCPQACASKVFPVVDRDIPPSRHKPVADLTGEDLSHLYELPARVVDLTDMPGLRLCVTRPETRGDQ